MFLLQHIYAGLSRQVPSEKLLKRRILRSSCKFLLTGPVTVASFDLASAQKRLLSCPLIKDAKVKLSAPDTVYVDYTVRQPVALLYDFENIALDEEGYPFPVSPFFTPKRLPEVYLGIRNFYWGRPLKEKKAELGLTILQLLNRLSLQVKRLDVSKAFEPSLGRREVVLILDEQGFTKALRLTPKDFAQELGNYLELRPKLPAIPQIIDLRIPQLAFIEEKKKDMQASEP
jgi:cell division septal protein FtsQ